MDFRTRVLVVDDEAVLRESLQDVLEAEGLSVCTASGGFEALALLQNHALPHVILLDLMMGLMSGWELSRRLDADPRLAGIPVILVSGAADVEEQAARLGTFGFLRKPLHIPALLRLIRSATNATRRHEESLPVARPW